MTAAAPTTNAPETSAPAATPAATGPKPKKGTSGLPPADSAPAGKQNKRVQRVAQLRGSVNDFLAFHKQWQEDENAPNPPEQYFDLADAVLRAFHDGDIPSELRPMAEAVKVFHVEAEKFMRRTNQKDQYPHRDFWASVERLEAVTKTSTGPSTLPPLESMHDLANDHIVHPKNSQITPEMIAKIYGCSIAEVLQELKEPGSVCTPEFMAAVELRRLQPTTRVNSIRDVDPIDIDEIESFILGDMPDSEIAATTGASVEEVARIRKGLQRQRQRAGA